MTDQTALATLLNRYQMLCRYCDDAFAATRQVWQTHIRCAPGCAACCILETVVPLEAYVITAYLKSLGAQTIITGAAAPDQCAFLYQKRCAIYPARPVICRTHGLPLAYAANQALDACPLNFAEVDLTALDTQFVLDAEAITQHLIRFNLAFCLLTQQPDAAGERIPLRSLHH